MVDEIPNIKKKNSDALGAGVNNDRIMNFYVQSFELISPSKLNVTKKSITFLTSHEKVKLD